MRTRIRKLRLRLASDRHFFPVLLAVFAGVCVIMLLAYTYTRKVVEDLVQAQVVQSLGYLDLEINLRVRELAAQTKIISQEGVLRLSIENSYLGGAAREAALRKLDGYVKDQVFDRFYLLDLKGNIKLSYDPGLAGTLDVSDRHYYLGARQGLAVLETISNPRGSKKPLLASSNPVLASDGSVAGVFVGFKETGGFVKHLEQLGIGQNGFAYILSREGKVLALPDGVSENEVASDGLINDLLNKPEKPLTIRQGSKGERRIFAVSQNLLTGWNLVVEAHEPEVLAPATRLGRVGGGVSFLTLALVGMSLVALRKYMVRLRDSEADQRTLTELSPVGIATLDESGRPEYLNRQAREILELPQAAALPQGLWFEDEFGRELNSEDSPILSALKEHKSIIGWLAWYRCEQGKRKALFVNASPLSSQAGKSRRLVATMEDITERVRTQEALRESEGKFRSIVESSPLGMHFYVVDSEERLILKDANPAAERMLGLNHANLLGKSLEEIFVSQDVRARAGIIRKMALEGIGKLTFEATFPVGQHERIFEIMFFNSGVRSATATFLDITERKQSEEELRRSEERFSKFFKLSPEAIVLVDMTSRKIKEVNQAYTQLTGYSEEESLGRTTVELNQYADVTRREVFYQSLMRDGFVENQEFEGRRKDGSHFFGSLSGQIIEVSGQKWLIAMIRDITEIKKMHEMMVQTEKMISVGGIAAGIAHEINNPLGIVLQASQNLAQRTKPDFPKNIEVAREIGVSMESIVQYMRARKLDVFIADIQSASLRASGIIRHMLDFSRRSESRRKICFVPEIMDRAIDLAANDYDLKKSYDFKNIHVERDYAEELPPIYCTETELEQVFLNLLRNAAQALAQADPRPEVPKIRISIYGRSNEFVIEIEDNGPGVPLELQKRVFEPFFTTKPPGIGTGLGLSVSYFIVTKGHGGTMSVSSQPGAGCVFRIVLPVADNAQS